jgi:hypothetical protein
MPDVFLSRRLFLLLLPLLFQPVAIAQPPTIDMPFPMGVQRGTTVELTLTGTHLQEPLGVLASFPVKAMFPTENNNGKEPGKLLLRLEVPPSVTLGWHSFRLMTKRGVSNVRLFCVDDLPQVLRTGAPHSMEQAQPVQAPGVICGKVDTAKADYYRIDVKAGERLSFEVLGRRLGSTLDPQLALYHGKTRKQLAYSDDARGQERDPRFTYPFTEAGSYLVEVRDSRQQSGKDWCYRLRIGDFPLSTVPMPLAVQRGPTTQVHFAGPNAGHFSAVTVTAPLDPFLNAMPVWPMSPPVFPHLPHGMAGWPVLLSLSEMLELTEVEPNDDPAQGMSLPVPCGVSGLIHKPGDRDHYRFRAKKGERFVIEAQTLELHAPATLQVRVTDQKNVQMVTTNPDMNQTRMDFTVPADGEYTLAVEHLFHTGGSDEAYHLVIRPFQTGFSVTLSGERTTVAQGGSVELTVNVTRREFDGPIEVKVAAPALAQGTVIIPAKQNNAKLRLTVSDKASLGAYPLRIVGQATINGKPVTEPADVTGVWRQALNNLPHPPRHLTQDVALGVRAKIKVWTRLGSVEW